MPHTRSANAVRLEFAPDSLVQLNLSGAAFTGDWLWVSGDEACGPNRLRRLLACLPIEPDAQGELCLVRQAQDGRRALRLKGDAASEPAHPGARRRPALRALHGDPGKDNGFDIDGLAVDGSRLLLGLRGPVLRGWSAQLEIAVEPRGDQLRHD